MKTLMTVAAALAGALLTQPAAARAIDCPLRDAPFSIDSPLIDILLSPAATAAVASEMPAALTPLPKSMMGTTAPSFAAILSLRGSGLGRAADPAKLAAVAARLAAVPVTAADRAVRCARYDDDRPSLALPPGKPRILLFEKINGYRDGPSVDAAHAAFVALAAQNGWTLAATDRGGAINPATLAKVDIVVWNNISGDVLTLSQRRALQTYVARGGGFVAVHGSGGDPVSFWDWYVDDLIGARFAGHPMKPQLQNARIVVEARDGPLAQRLPAEWVMKDEWYSFKASPRARGAAILATLDETSYNRDGYQSAELTMGKDHPIAWSRCVGRGRIFYSAIGHAPSAYSDANYRTMLTNALRWAAAGRRHGCTAEGSR